MKTINYTTKILKASKGHYLTEVNPIGESTIATVVSLGEDMTEADWKEITTEEGNTILRERKEAEEQRLLAEREEATKASMKPVIPENV